MPANYQLCAFKEHYQDKDLQLYTLMHTIPPHPLSPPFPASALPPPELSCLDCSSPLSFFFKLFSTPLSHLLPTTPMILFFSVPASSFQPVFISCSPFIYPYPPNSNPILSFSSLVATFPICFSPTPLTPPPPPLRLPSLPQLLFFFLLAQNRHLNNEPGVSQTARELH